MQSTPRRLDVPLSTDRHTRSARRLAQSILASTLLVCLVSLSPRALAEETVLVDQGSSCRWLAASDDPGLGLTWTDASFDDSSWSTGSFGVGYDAGDMIETTVPEGTKVVWTRHRFRIDDLASVDSIHFDADYDDGYVAWLNGVEIERSGSMPDGVPTFSSEPENHESSNGSSAEFDSISDLSETALPLLVEGDNVLAVGVWNDDVDSSDLALLVWLSLNRPPPIDGTDLCGSIDAERTLTLDESPYIVTCDLVVTDTGTLRIEPGVEIYTDADIDIRIEGSLQALGSVEAPVRFLPRVDTWAGIDIDLDEVTSPRPSELRYVELRGGERLLDVSDTGDAEIIVEDCSFDDWTSKALSWDAANGLRITRCRFGLDTDEGERDHETINGYRASVIVEYCTFGPRTGYNDVIDLGDSSWGGPVPTIRYNTFLGGEDDAIDFDGADGWIIGNLIQDHRPRAGSTSSANGGGITGSDNSRPIVLNNIVYRCFHGIGYKDGVEPLIVGNLILECNVGVTFYRADCDENDAVGALRNNILWNNRHFESGEPQNLLLHGRWWPEYCQDDGDQGAADLAYNIIEGGWDGTGNLDLDPLLVDPANGVFSPSLASPALDAGFAGLFEIPGVDAETLRTALGRDLLGTPRVDLPCIEDRGAGTVTFADIGPYEVELPGPCSLESPFLRGDSNGDGRLNLSDAVRILLGLFAGEGATSCPDAEDVDDNGRVDLTDAVRLLAYLFQQGPAPAAPIEEAGADPTEDELDCQRGLAD